MYTKTKGGGKLVSSSVQSCTYSSPVPVFPFSQNRKKKTVEGDTPHVIPYRESSFAVTSQMLGGMLINLINFLFDTTGF